MAAMIGVTRGTTDSAKACSSFAPAGRRPSTPGRPRADIRARRPAPPAARRARRTSDGTRPPSRRGGVQAPALADRVVGQHAHRTPAQPGREPTRMLPAQRGCNSRNPSIDDGAHERPDVVRAARRVGQDRGQVAASRRARRGRRSRAG